MRRAVFLLVLAFFLVGFMGNNDKSSIELKVDAYKSPLDSVQNSDKSTIKLMKIADESPSNPVELSFKKAVISYGDAMVKRRWEKVVPYMVKTAILHHGGVEGTVKALEKVGKYFIIKSWVVNKVQVEHSVRDCYTGVAHITCLADSYDSINRKWYKVKLETGAIGHTTDGGSTWRFMSIYLGTSIPRLLFPLISSGLDIPKEKFYIKENGRWVLP